MTARTSSLAADVAGLLGGRADVMADRFRVYRRLREEAPVYRLPDQVLLTRWSDVSQVLVDPAFQSGFGADVRSSRERAALERSASPTARRQFLEIADFEQRWLSRRDGQRHERLRQAVHRAFTPAAVRKLQERIQQHADTLLDRAAARDGGRIEVVADFAFHLPLIVVCELLGMPIEDRHLIRRWSGDLAQLLDTDYASYQAQIHQSVVELREYVRAHLARRHDRGRPELVQLLLAAIGEFSEDDVVALVGQLVFAGHETTTNLITSSLHALLSDPRQWQLLLDSPDAVPNAVEELLRFRSPAQMVRRIATRETMVGGVPIHAWDTLLLFIGSANRDPQRFAEPDRLDVTRTDVRHLAFGHGPHFCLGASLSRLETAVALRTILLRFPRTQLASAEVSWLSNVTFHAVEALPLILRP